MDLCRDQNWQEEQADYRETNEPLSFPLYTVSPTSKRDDGRHHEHVPRGKSAGPGRTVAGGESSQVNRVLGI